MRAISASLANHLTGTNLTLAACVLVTRQDGISLGFTSCDADLVINGVTYQASSSFDPSAVRAEIGAAVDNLELIGMLKSGALTDADLLAGRYDGATVQLFLVNWQDLTQGTLILLTGVLGDATFEDGRWTLEFRSLSQRLNQNIGELTTPLCRVLQFGDVRCSAPGGSVLPGATNFQESKSVVSVISSTRLNFGADANPTTYFAHGVCQITTGLNAGFSREIKSQVVSPGNCVIDLAEAFPFTVGPGDTALLTGGCDRTVGSCTAKGNLINFRGEPYLPGTDQILQRGRRG